jgi:hypothetical protein
VRRQKVSRASQSCCGRLRATDDQIMRVRQNLFVRSLLLKSAH